HTTCISATSPLSLHDALPIWRLRVDRLVTLFVLRLSLVRNIRRQGGGAMALKQIQHAVGKPQLKQFVLAAGYFKGEGVVGNMQPDRKSTRLNSSHVKISYAVF